MYAKYQTSLLYFLERRCTEDLIFQIQKSPFLKSGRIFSPPRKMKKKRKKNRLRFRKAQREGERGRDRGREGQLASLAMRVMFRVCRGSARASNLMTLLVLVMMLCAVPMYVSQMSGDNGAGANWCAAAEDRENARSPAPEPEVVHRPRACSSWSSHTQPISRLVVPTL